MGINNECKYCMKDEPISYKDKDNCVFIDDKGELFIEVQGKVMRVKVDYCPKCGKKF